MSKGFTLIELLVVVAIMGILLGIGVTSYLSYNNRELTIQAANTFVSSLRNIQKQADAGAYACPTNQSYDGIRLTYVNDQTVQVANYCNNTEPQNDNNTIYNLTLPINHTLSSFTAFTFLPLGLGISQDTVITITGPSLSYDINLNLAGNIYQSEHQDDN